jgi:3-phytase
MKNMGARSRLASAIHRNHKKKARSVLALCLLAATSACKDECPVDSTGRCVVADVETFPVESRGDAADDSVVLVGDSTTWIAGTDKQFGLLVYEMSGAQAHALAVGRLNNIDAIELDSGFLVAATNRTKVSIDLFRIDPDNDTVELATRIPLDMEDPYGLCMAWLDGTATIFAGDKPGRIERWTVDTNYQAALVDELSFRSQTEGCVVDAPRNTLYVGEETVGIWAIKLDGSSRELIDRTGRGRLVADVEGLDIYRSDTTDYLVASSQGDNTFVIYELPGGEALVKFRIGSDPEGAIDGVSDTDGVAVSAAEIAGFPRGVMVVQDGADSGESNRQNFKIVDWRKIEALLE